MKPLFAQRPRAEFSKHFDGYEWCTPQQYDEVIAWCMDQFGPPWKTWSHTSALSMSIYFVRDEDAFAFKMRWC